MVDLTPREYAMRDMLIDILGSKNVYFQPPSNIRIGYPCIICNPEVADKKTADNGTYLKRKKYSLTVIAREFNSDIADRIEDSFLLCSIDRRYVADNLHHWAMTLYF